MPSRGAYVPPYTLYASPLLLGAGRWKWEEISYISRYKWGEAQLGLALGLIFRPGVQQGI